MVRWEGFLLTLVFPLVWLLNIHSITNAIKKSELTAHFFLLGLELYIVFYISGTTFSIRFIIYQSELSNMELPNFINIDHENMNDSSF